MLPLVSSLAQVNAFSNGYGSIRYQSGSGQTEFPDGRVHNARDYYLPEGSKLYFPVAGVFDGWVPSNEDGSLSMGWIAKLIGDDGNYYRFVHISVATQQPFTKGQRIARGTYMGSTSLHNLGASKSHLHLDVARGAKNDPARRFDPTTALGVEGFNVMIHGLEAVGEEGFRMTPGAILLSIFGGSALLAGAIYLGRTRASRSLRP